MRTAPPTTSGIGAHLGARLLVGWLLVVVLGGGCAGSTASPSATGGGPGPVSEEQAMELAITQPRYLQGTPRVAVAVTNTGAVDLVVRTVTLRPPGFAPLPTATTSSRVPAGARVDVQVDVGAVSDCAIDAVGPVEVTVETERAGAPSRRTTRAVDPGPLAVAHADECARRALAAAVDVGLGDRLDPLAGPDGDERLVTDLEVVRVGGDQPVTVTSVRGSVLFVLRPAVGDGEPGRSVGVLAGGERELVVPVELSVSRCDPHVVGQASKPYDLKAFVALGDGAPILVPLDVGDALRSELDALLARCQADDPSGGSPSG